MAEKRLILQAIFRNQKYTPLRMSVQRCVENSGWIFIK